MCGLCAEGRAVELAKALTIGKSWPPELEDFYLFDVFYVQESQDSLSAIQRMENKLTKSLAQLEKGMDTLEWQELVQLRVVFCRVIEILVKNGFETHEYNKLIALPFVSNIIKVVCQFPPSFDERLFEPSSSLRKFFQPDFFFAPPEILNNSEFRSDCMALLDAYINWWHYGKGMGEVEGDLFQTIYPYVFLSYTVVEKYYPEHEVINRLICKSPHFGLTPDNFDAWLQRKAAIQVFDTLGITAFLPYKDEPRPQLLYYLVVKNKLNLQEKQCLRESILQSGQYEKLDSSHWASIKKYLLIWDKTASWIMEALDN